MMGIGTALNPFTVRPSYKALESLPHRRSSARACAIRKCGGKFSPKSRRKPKSPSSRNSARPSRANGTASTSWAIRRITSRRRRRASPRSPRANGRPPDEVAYDYITGDDGQYLYFPVVNYVVGDHEPIREMLNDPACLFGLSDGGAHCTSIVDAGVPTFMLMHWGRDRSRGPRLPLEHLVKRQTSETADFFGLSDRGRLRRGMRADVN